MGLICYDVSMDMKALVLDFDGVISDSAPEAFVVAFRTYVELYPRSPFARTSRPLLQSTDIHIADITNDPFYRRFLHLMPLGNRAEDYGVILRILEQDIEIEDQATYDQQRQSWPSMQLNRFHNRFYEVRETFFNADPVTWRALIGPFSDFVNILHRHAEECTLAIATAKDRGSVIRLLSDYGIQDLFPEERLLDKETGVNKIDHLRHLHQQLNLEYAQITFVDDKVSHLDAVAPLGVRCILAGWGYNGQREQQLASLKGYLVCGLEDVEKSLFVL